jgi:iron complex transport system ATP-binding protein
MTKILEINQLMIGRGPRLLGGPASFDIVTGQRWGIIGKNGRGKSTLLHTLAGLHPTISGTISCLGESLAQLPRRAIAKRLSLLLQNHHCLFPTTVVDVILSGRHALRQKDDVNALDNLLKMLELEPLSMLPLNQLSGGEQQRVALARIIYQKPQLFLLDEPTQQLDPRMQHQILQHFSLLCASHNKAMMFSSHDINLIEQYCDYVLLMMPNGRLLYGAKNELLTQKNLELLFDCQWQKVGLSTWQCYGLDVAT